MHITILSVRLSVIHGAGHVQIQDFLNFLRLPNCLEIWITFRMSTKSIKIQKVLKFHFRFDTVC